MILAEGLPVESYLDTGDRANFANAGETIRLFPDFAARFAPGTAQLWETRGAAPLVVTGEALQVARRLIDENAHVSHRDSGCGNAALGSHRRHVGAPDRKAR